MTSQTNIKASTEEDPLPEHWEMRVDQRTGMPYFLNHLEQLTTWDDPRVVGKPRSMLNNNNMGLLRRSASPTPQTARVRMASEEPQRSSQSNQFLSAPSQPAFTQSLPRRRNQPSAFQRNPFIADDWFKTGFGEVDSDFFDDPSWPYKAHTLQRPFPRREGSPLASQQPQQADSPRHSPSRFSPQRFQPSQQRRQEEEYSIPIHADSPDRESPARDGSVQEHFITPTRYKQKVNPTRNNEEATEHEQQGRVEIPIKTEKSGQHSTSSYSPRPKQSRKDETVSQDTDVRKMSVDDSDADAVLRRMNSVYDNDGHSEDEVDASTEQGGDNDRQRTIMDKSVEIEIQRDGGSPNKSSSEASEETKNPEEEKSENDIDEVKRCTNGQDEDKETQEQNNNESIKLSIQSVDKIRQEVDSYTQELDTFNGEKNSKEYRYLEEMLTRCQLALDNVQTFGDLSVRKHRKDTVNYIESLIMALEQKTS